MKKWTQILSGVYLITGKRSNIYLLDTGDEESGLVLVDTGMPDDGGTILTAIGDIGYAPTDVNHILITHAHLDHVGSLARIKGATGGKLVAGEIERDHIEGRKMLCSMNREGIRGAAFRVLLFIFETNIAEFHPVKLDAVCAGKTGLHRIGDIDIIETPGHSPGSLAFHHRKKRLVIAGDVFRCDNRPHLPQRYGCSNYQDALNSVRRIATLNFDHLLPGHGSPIIGNGRAQIKLLAQTIP